MANVATPVHGRGCAVLRRRRLRGTVISAPFCPPSGSFTIQCGPVDISPEFHEFIEACRPKYQRSYDFVMSFARGEDIRLRVFIGEPIGDRFPIHTIHGPRMRDGRWSPIEALPASDGVTLEDPEAGRTWALPQVRGVTVGGRKL